MTNGAKELVLATNNQHKLKEFREILEPLGCRVLSLGDCSIECEVEEDMDSFEGNALKKAREVANLCGFPVIADDSGLAVETLGGAPGVYSARYAHDEHFSGDIDSANNDKLLRQMQGETNRAAKYVCALAYVPLEGEHKIFIGECGGSIAHEKSGAGGFGYDCLFLPEGYDVTMASITAEEKNKISHRYKAINQLVWFFNKVFAG